VTGFRSFTLGMTRVILETMKKMTLEPTSGCKADIRYVTMVDGKQFSNGRRKPAASTSSRGRSSFYAPASK
jgi:hypothetical protein